MSKIVISSDFFLGEVFGGAEYYNEELMQTLAKDHDVIAMKSAEFNLEFFKENKDAFFIVSNFMLLSEAVKQALIADVARYVILEHDHKYAKSNNPLAYSNSIVPEKELINKEFYRGAEAVLCQSTLHAECVRKNLLADNIVNLGCNLWSESTLGWLEDNLGAKKTREYGVLQSGNKNKGMPQTIEYCRKHNLDFEMISFANQEKFFKELAKTKKLVFMPQWMESFCRVAVEARILGCGLITNNALGCASEDFFKLKGKELLDAIKAKREDVLQVYRDLISGVPIDYLPALELPKVTVISTFYDGEKYIEGFLQSLEDQTLIDAQKVQFIFIDANSPGNEEKYVKRWKKRFVQNAVFKKNDTRITTAEAFNQALEIATGEFIVFACVDDRLAPDHLEVLCKHLFLDPDIDLVYGDCLQTTEINETVEENSSKGRFYEHSRMPFTPENMIKSLPGPMPMFRRSMIEKHGTFKNDLKFSSDWELWLRCVRGGSKFKKVDKVVGLYYYNKEGLSTAPENTVPKLKEEAEVFNEYKDVIGEKNYETFKDYFNAV